MYLSIYSLHIFLLIKMYSALTESPKALCKVPIIIRAFVSVPQLRNHFYREGLDGLYSSATFLIAYTVHIFPFVAVASVIFSSFLYW